MRGMAPSGLLVLFASLVSLQSAAQTVTLPVTQDTWIAGLGDTTPHGGDLTLGLCPGAYYWAYLKFDLGGLTGSVVSAELRMTRFSGARPEEISVFLIQNDSWTEATLTGPTRPAPMNPLDSEALASGQISAGGYDRWTSAALTSAVRQQAQGDRTISLMVRENPVPMIDIRYYRSREAAVPAANKPQLVVTLAPLEVSSLTLDGANPPALHWASQGAGVTYDIVSGTFADLRADGGVARAACLAGGVPAATFTDPRPDPPSGSGDYYVLRARNGAATGTYGFASSGSERIPNATCP